MSLFAKAAGYRPVCSLRLYFFAGAIASSCHAIMYRSVPRSPPQSNFHPVPAQQCSIFSATTSSLNRKSKGTTASKMTLVWVGPATMRKSWMEMASSIQRTHAATRRRISAVTPSSVTMGSMWTTASQPSFSRNSFSTLSISSCSSSTFSDADTSAWREIMQRPGP